MQRIIPLINRIVLLALVLLVFGRTFVPRFHIPNGETIFYVLFAVYVLLNVIELILNLVSMRSADGKTYLSFRYLTRLFLFKKLMVNVLILTLAFFAYTRYAVPPEPIVFLFGIAVIDIVSFITRLISGYYRVMLEEYTLSIVTDLEKVVHSARIAEVEFRYDIFFFKMKDENVHEVSVENIAASRRKVFVSEMVAWIERHNVKITDEGQVNLRKWL